MVQTQVNYCQLCVKAKCPKLCTTPVCLHKANHKFHWKQIVPDSMLLNTQNVVTYYEANQFNMSIINN